MAEKKPKAVLYEYAVIHNPTKKDSVAKILVDVTQVLARTEKEVVILAAREIPDDYLDRLEEVDIAVRPF